MLFRSIQKGPLPGEVTEAPQPEAASQDFEKQLALVTLPVQESLKDKEQSTNHPYSYRDSLGIVATTPGSLGALPFEKRVIHFLERSTSCFIDSFLFLIKVCWFHGNGLRYERKQRTEQNKYDTVN